VRRVFDRRFEIRLPCLSPVVIEQHDVLVQRSQFFLVGELRYSLRVKRWRENGAAMSAVFPDDFHEWRASIEPND
jgi:hypothetical protein